MLRVYRTVLNNLTTNRRNGNMFYAESYNQEWRVTVDEEGSVSSVELLSGGSALGTRTTFKKKPQLGETQLTEAIKTTCFDFFVRNGQQVMTDSLIEVIRGRDAELMQSTLQGIMTDCQRRLAMLHLGNKDD